MRREYVIAYDLGTSGVKAVLTDLKGHFIDAATEEYPLITPKAGWAEQDPEVYWRQVGKVTRKVLEKSGYRPEDACGIAFGTQWKGIIPVDADGTVLHHSIIWLDARAGKQAEALNRYFGKELFCAADYWPKVMWFRENCPDLYERAVTIFEANSFLKWKATGKAAVDVTNHFTRSFDQDLQRFYDAYLEAAGLDAEKFPPLVKPEDLVGHVTERAAREMGLVPGIPVYGGCGDIPAITIGSGSTDLGQMHAYFGSSGWLGLVKRHSSEDLYISPFDEKRDIALFAMQSIGLSLNWTVSQMYRREQEEMGGEVFSYLNQELLQIPPGSEGVLATPWFFGERPPHLSPSARGNFLNLNSCHDRRHMVRALMEGVCYTLRMNVEDYWKESGTRPDRIHAVGGGSLSDVWMQALADILDIPVSVPGSPRHAGAIGTAYCALIGLGCCENFREAAGQIEIERSFEPRPEAVKIYHDAYQVFSGLYELLEPLY